MEVLVNGRACKEYAQGGRTYVEAKKGSTFTIKFRNNSSERVLFVPTVDGLSVMNGKDGSYKSSGYIVRAHSSVNVDGWRKTDKDVAEFYFTNPEDSYRKRMKKGSNLGTIGVAVFKEKEKPKPIVIKEYIPMPCNHFHGCNCTWQHNHYFGNNTISLTNGTAGITGANNQSTWTATTGNQMLSVSNNTSANYSIQTSSVQASAANIAQDLGTGWGKIKESEVVSVEFERAATPTSTMTVYYNSRERLEEAGVTFKEATYIDRNPFPGEFCEAPEDN